jgi:uncharacterized membrane protein
MTDYIKLIHLIAATLWMGGMGFMLLALNPAMRNVLAQSERLTLLRATWHHFFSIVWVCILALVFTGNSMYTTSFRAIKAATGQGSVPSGWNIMLVLGLLMVAIFAYIYWGLFTKFKRAITALDWPLADKLAAKMRGLILVNFIVGWLAISAVHLVR